MKDINGLIFTIGDILNLSVRDIEILDVILKNRDNKAIIDIDIYDKRNIANKLGIKTTSITSALKKFVKLKLFDKIDTNRYKLNKLILFDNYVEPTLLIKSVDGKRYMKSYDFLDCRTFKIYSIVNFNTLNDDWFLIDEKNKK